MSSIYRVSQNPVVSSCSFELKEYVSTCHESVNWNQMEKAFVLGDFGMQGEY